MKLAPLFFQQRADKTDAVGEVSRIGATATGGPGAIPWLFRGAQQATGEVAPIFARIYSKRRNPQLVDIGETCACLLRSCLDAVLLLVSAPKQLLILPVAP